MLYSPRDLSDNSTLPLQGDPYDSSGQHLTVLCFQSKSSLSLFAVPKHAIVWRDCPAWFLTQQRHWQQAIRLESAPTRCAVWPKSLPFLIPSSSFLWYLIRTPKLNPQTSRTAKVSAMATNKLVYLRQKSALPYRVQSTAIDTQLYRNEVQLIKNYHFEARVPFGTNHLLQVKKSTRACWLVSE